VTVIDVNGSGSHPQLAPRPRRYVLRVIGHGGELVSQRYNLQYQAIGKLAALSVPQAELERLLQDAHGNVSAVLTPMSAALREKGYDTLMVIPAQSAVVELHELPNSPPEAPTPTPEQLFERAKELEVRTARLLLQAREMLAELANRPGTDPALQASARELCRQMAVDAATKG